MKCNLCDEKANRLINGACKNCWKELKKSFNVSCKEREQTINKNELGTQQPKITRDWEKDHEIYFKKGWCNDCQAEFLSISFHIKQTGHIGEKK